MKVGIHELEVHLSDYLNRVRDGETIEVTDQDKVVARIEPPREEGPTPHVQRLIESGLLVYKRPHQSLMRPIRLLPGPKSGADYVSEQRQ